MNKKETLKKLNALIDNYIITGKNKTNPKEYHRLTRLHYKLTH